jgi:hypothetical protein
MLQGKDVYGVWHVSGLHYKVPYFGRLGYVYGSVD